MIEEDRGSKIEDSPVMRYPLSSIFHLQHVLALRSRRGLRLLGRRLLLSRRGCGSRVAGGWCSLWLLGLWLDQRFTVRAYVGWVDRVDIRPGLELGTE